MSPMRCACCGRLKADGEVSIWVWLGHHGWFCYDCQAQKKQPFLDAYAKWCRERPKHGTWKDARLRALRRLKSLPPC